jgi:hypothetical protein
VHLLYRSSALECGLEVVISSISASVGGESHEANFFTSFEASKGAMPYWSEEETFQSLI